jgi:flagellin
LSGLASSINAQQGTSGITAVADLIGGTITLTNSLGYDIGITNTGSVTGPKVAALDGNGVINGGGSTAALVAGSVAGSSFTVGGSLKLNATNGFTVTSTLAYTGGAVFGLAAGGTTAVSGSTLVAVSAIDVTTLTGGTPSGANNAIQIIDGALGAINASRALLGAMQNRFTSVISNLNATSQNLTASRSRIQDTDFAAETANLTRGQILQQAGTAMLAQANSLPNGVMALLR